MKRVFWLEIIVLCLCRQSCHSSTMIMNVVEIVRNKQPTLSCNVLSSTILTRWTYLSGPTGTSLISYQNGRCTLSPSDSFLCETSLYSYTCNSTVYQVQPYGDGHLNNKILACRDAKQLDKQGSTWMIKIVSDDDQCHCDQTITFSIKDITEGDNVTFICSVESNGKPTTWIKNFKQSAVMGVDNGQCATQGITFLDNRTDYIYTCNHTVYQVTRLNIQRREHNDMFVCMPFGMAQGMGSNWIIKVKAVVTSVTLTHAHSTVNVMENETVKLTCITSSARPAASVYWYIHPNGNSNDITRIIDNITTTTDYNDLSVITSTLHFVPTRQHNDMKIYCEANNSANTSPVKSNKILLNVQYKAEDLYIAQGKEYRVIVNKQGTLTCNVRDGNPTPTLSWSCTNFSSTHQSTISSNGNTTKTFTWTPTKTHEGKCTCTSTQTNFKTRTKDVSIVVLYPPSKPIFKVNGYSIVGNILFIEGTTRSITCTADSKPSPNRFTWTGPSHIDSSNQSTLIFNTIEKKDAGEYGCCVRNTMNSSDDGNVADINNSTINVVVLYSPVALPINNTSILQGKNLTIRCPYTAGMPSETSFVWTRNIDDKQWDGEYLQLPYVKKSDAANYSCYISNTMRPSGESIVYIGNDTQSFRLNVLYEANVTSFTIDGIASTTVTINESDPVQFACKADSNPTAYITLSHDNELLKTELSNIVKHDISQSRCSDAGKYVCYARNEYNAILSASKEVQLYVNCYPRMANDIRSNITSERNTTITITLNVVAYPPPTFSWYKLVEEQWRLLYDDVNYLLSSSAVQSNLTIQSVGANDFTRFKVHAKNDYGEMNQLYYLSQYDKPVPPINFTHIESRTTTTSIHLLWTAGFDNGLPQTFYIKYKKISDNVWNYRNVSDNGESTMEIQLTGLTENTQYEFVIFASNVKGNSSELSLTADTLNVIENSPANPAPLIGGIAGGVTGCVIIFIVIIVIIRRYPLCIVCSEKLSREKSDKINNKADEHNYYNTGRSEEITNQDNDNKAYNTIKSDANTNDKSTEDVAYYNVANVSEYEMIHRTNVETTLYSTLDQTELGTRSAATNDDKKAVYENLKLQVF